MKKRSQAHKVAVRKLKVQIATKDRAKKVRRSVALPFKPNTLTVEEIRAAVKQVAA